MPQITDHPVEIKWRADDPDLGKMDDGLPIWIRTFCNAYDRQEPYSLSKADVESLLHTLIAAKARAERLVKERDAAIKEYDLVCRHWEME